LYGLECHRNMEATYRITTSRKGEQGDMRVCVTPRFVKRTGVVG
jgi:hypothetical protein